MGVETALDGTLLNPDDYAYPCGLIAFTYAKWGMNTGATAFSLFSAGDSAPELIEFDKSDIAWKSDREFKFKNQLEGNWESKQWMDVEDPDFMVWFSPATSRNFLKQLGRIEKGIPAGDYTIEVQNGWQDAGDMFGGEKNFVLMTTTPLGGGNSFLGVLYLITAFVLLFLTAAFATVYCYQKKK